MTSYRFKAQDAHSSPTVVQLFSHMFRLPILAMVCGMEMFLKTLHGLQKMADHSIDGLTAEQAPTLGNDSAALPISSESSPPAPPKISFPMAIVGSANKNDETIEQPNKERTTMPDTNLNDDMLKLVRYKILFVKRDYEYAFPEQEELVWENMTDTGFTAWKVAEFIQRLGTTKTPEKWCLRHYPPTPRAGDPCIESVKADASKVGSKDAGKEASGPTANREYINWLPEEDKKYLRVYYEVMARYSREKFKHDERQIEVLEEIRDRLPIPKV